MKKRVLSAALSLCLLLTLLPTAALATEDNTTPGTSPASTLPESKDGVIKLTENVALTKTASISENTTLDLNGYTVSAGTTALSVTNNAKLIVQDSSVDKTGKISSTNTNDCAAVQLNSGKLVLESGCIESTQYGVSVFEGSTATINGGSITSEYACLSGNNTKGDMNFIVTGGTLTSTKSEAIYMPGQVTLDISGGVVKGGISARMGQIKISGGEIYGMTTEQAKDSIAQYWNYSGSAWIGDAIYVWGGTYTSDNEQYGNSCNIEITGGKINGESMSAIAIYNIGNNYDQAINLDISGDPEITGDVKIISGDDTWKDYSSETHAHTITSDVEISGGTFSANVTDFLAEGTTLYSTQDTVDTWGEYIAVLGNVTVPGSDLKYSGVPAIYAAMAKGYSDLWALGNYTTVPQTEALDALKANLLKTVQDYNLYLLQTAYNEGNGYQVGDTTYMMPEQAYTAAKAAINDTSDLSAILTAYQTAVDSQYIKDALGIASVGFQADAEAANGAINEIIKGLDGTAGSVKDCDANTMYIALSQRTNADDQQGYDVKVTNEAGETVYSEEIAKNEAAGVIYFTFESNGGSHATEALASGTYTVSLLKSGWTDPINTMTITLAQVSYDTNGGTPEAIASFYTDTNNTVTLPVAPNKSGYTFDGWKSSADNSVTQAGAKVAVSADTTFTAQWSKRSSGSHGGSGSSGGSASTTYTLTFETNGGSAISKVTKNKGTTIDLAQYAPTKSGATFEGWYADKGLTKKITSVKLDANTTVYAKWTEAPVSGLPFGDVKSADWFYNDVKYVYEKGMMAGTAADVFAPNATTTRAMIVTILYRLEGSPAVTGTNAFADVPAGQWYTDAVNWAAANQIVKGTSATTFAPNDSITREQMAAILYRYAQYKGYDVTKKADLSGYSDNGQVSAYAKDALAWANAAKLINGVTNTTLAPQGNATRAQVSAILHRFCDGVVK